MATMKAIRSNAAGCLSRIVRQVLVLGAVLAAGWVLSGCKPAAKAGGDGAAASKGAGDIAGVYTLVSVDGKKLPATIAHDGVNLEIRSGSFTIQGDGTCGSKMVFVPPKGTEATREVAASYVRDGSKLRMQWQGAGRTEGSVESGTFTMHNEGMVLVYRK